jgi:hypothetical protein
MIRIHSNSMKSGEMLNTHDDHPKNSSFSLAGRNREFGFLTMKLRLLRDPDTIGDCIRRTRGRARHYLSTPRIPRPFRVLCSGSFSLLLESVRNRTPHFNMATHMIISLICYSSAPMAGMSMTVRRNISGNSTHIEESISDLDYGSPFCPK